MASKRTSGQGVRWLTSPDLGLAVATWSESVVPLLRPGSRDLASLWEVVLYKLLKLSVLDRLPGTPLRVWCLDEQVSPAASFFAWVRGAGAPLPWAAEPAPDSEAGWRSVVFGMAESFTPEAILSIQDRLGEPHGIVTGPDLPSIWFMAVKIALAAALDVPGEARIVELFDELAGAHLWNVGGEEVEWDDRVELWPDRVLRPERDRQGLVLHVHGEGSHANLRELVLCGAPEEGERAGAVRVVGGCSGGAERRCKRGDPMGARVAGFSELPDREVVLLSCSSLSTSGSLFSSDNSAISSLVTGPCTRAVCNDRTVPMNHGDARLVAALWGAGLNLWDLVALLNERELHRRGVAPWLLVGEPPAETWARTDEPVVLARGLCIHPCAEGEAVIMLDADHAWRGRTQLVVLGPREAGWFGAVGELEALSTSVGAVLCKASALSIFAASVGWSAGASELAAMVRASSALVRRSEEARRDGYLPVQLKAATASLELLESALGREVVRHISKELLGAGLEKALLAGCVSHGDLPDGACPRCRRSTRREHFTVLVGGRTRVAETCPVCGPVAIGPEIPSLATVAEARVNPHVDEHLTIELWLEGGGPDVAGWVAVGVQNKARGEQVWEAVVAVGAEPSSLSVPLAGLVEPDLHTLRLVACVGLELHFRRLRVASVPLEGKEK
jgi:hypothetical protein